LNKECLLVKFLHVVEIYLRRRFRPKLGRVMWPVNTGCLWPHTGNVRPRFAYLIQLSWGYNND